MAGFLSGLFRRKLQNQVMLTVTTNTTQPGGVWTGSSAVYITGDHNGTAYSTCGRCGVAIEMNDAGWWEVGTCRQICGDGSLGHLHSPTARPEEPPVPIEDPVALERWLES